MMSTSQSHTGTGSGWGTMTLQEHIELHENNTVCVHYGSQA